MALKHRIQAVRTLYYDIESVTIGSRANNRYVIADVYQIALYADNYFPKRPVSMLSTTPANLRQKVSNTCSMCISSSAMERIVEGAKRTLLEYKRSLKAWLEEHNVELDETGQPVITSVHDLDSNL